MHETILENLPSMSDEEIRLLLNEMDGSKTSLQEMGLNPYAKNAKTIFAAKQVLLQRHSKILETPYFYGCEESTLKICLNILRTFFKYEILAPVLLGFVMGFFFSVTAENIISQGLIWCAIVFAGWAVVYALRHHWKSNKAQKLINIREKYVYGIMDSAQRLKNISTVNLELQKLGPIWVRDHESTSKWFDDRVVINTAEVLLPGYQPYLTNEAYAVCYHYYGSYAPAFLALTILTGIFPVMGSLELGLYLSTLLQ